MDYTNIGLLIAISLTLIVWIITKKEWLAAAVSGCSTIILAFLANGSPLILFAGVVQLVWAYRLYKK